jgi:hypothetical protein
MNLNERLQALNEAIIRPSFKQSKGLGNEIGYYIFDYDAKDEMIVREWVRTTVERSRRNEFPLSICLIDVFDTMVEIMKDKGFYEKLVEMDSQKGSDSLLEPLRRTLRLNDKQGNLLTARILEALKPDDVLFLTGVGKAFPAIRSHGLLNELHARVNRNPVLLFFPGTYSDGSFKLFGKIKSEDYYRGFKIVS